MSDAGDTSHFANDVKLTFTDGATRKDAARPGAHSPVATIPAQFAFELATGS